MTAKCLPNERLTYSNYEKFECNFVAQVTEFH